VGFASAPARRADLTMRFAVAALAVVAAAVAAVLIATSMGGSGDAVKPGSAPGSDSKRDAVIWAVGDGADGGASAARVARLIARDRPDRLLYLGDVYEEGTASDFRRHYASSFGRLSKRTAPTPGNHDWSNHLDGYDPYWSRVYGGDLHDYFAFSTGGWQLLSLNSEIPHDTTSPQLKWLRAKLRRAGDCRLAFWHRPRYSAGDHHGDQPDVEPFWDELAGHARLVLNGHEHDMQRFTPHRGITELVSGAGGHDLYSVDSRHGLAFGDDSHFGALRLSLSRGFARYRFVAASGRTLDRGSTRCRPIQGL
jgi:hypothetical protein